MLDTLEKNKELLKFNAEGKEPKDIFAEASLAGRNAVEEYHAKHGEPLYCGFGHVAIYPARGRFISFLKKIGIGSKGYKGGYDISYYDIMGREHPLSYTQSLDLKEICCDAFADVLKKYGMTAYGVGMAD
tara:strand:+ start:238 stop:627 length:390 start_codon:yes stop_codon:yes gene_type:complete